LGLSLSVRRIYW